MASIDLPITLDLCIWMEIGMEPQVDTYAYVYMHTQSYMWLHVGIHGMNAPSWGAHTYMSAHSHTCGYMYACMG